MAAALRLELADLVKATLPQGLGRVGFLGLAPLGDAYHVLAPMDMTWAQAVGVWGARGQLDQGGARMGWLYHLCRPYALPSSHCGRPLELEDFRRARRDQALANGRQLAAWGQRHGWWLEVEDPPAP